MSTRYGVKFGSGNPQTYAGLTPTFIILIDNLGATYAGPSITELGSSIGFYKFEYAPSPTLTFFFTIDGGAAIVDTASRYISGSIDPVINVDQQLGFSTDSYGTTAAPSSVFGYVKRANEQFQSVATFSKTSGIWSVYAAGTSTLLMSKTLANSLAETTKT